MQIGNLVGPEFCIDFSFASGPHQSLLSRLANRRMFWHKKNKVKSLSTMHSVSFFGNLLDLILTDGRTYPRKGKILLADRQVDPNTGTIRIVAAFPNPGNVLRAWPVWTRACRNQHEERRSADTSKRRWAIAGRLSGGRGRPAITKSICVS